MHRILKISNPLGPLLAVDKFGFHNLKWITFYKKTPMVFYTIGVDLTIIRIFF